MNNSEVMDRYRDGDIYKHNLKRLEVIGGSETIGISYRDRLMSFSEDIAIRLKHIYNFKGTDIRFIVNGDYITHTTNRHISDAISTLKGNIQIPFSALYRTFMGTPLTYEDIEILDMTGDEYEEKMEIIDKWISVEDVEKLQKSISTTLHLDGGFDLKKRIEEMGFSSKLPSNWKCSMSENGMEIEIRYKRHHLGSVLFKVREGKRSFRYFLSSREDWDRLKRGFDGYFLVELPSGVLSISDAYNSLIPSEVINLERIGRGYRRQGEYFFVEATSGEVKEFRKMSKKRTLKDKFYNLKTKEYYNIDGRTTTIHKRQNIVDYFLPPVIDGHGHVLRGSMVRGNPHTARDLMVSKRSKKFPKKILVRGSIRHPEHKTLTLQKWHWVFINRAKESWGISGRVD